MQSQLEHVNYVQLVHTVLVERIFINVQSVHIHHRLVLHYRVYVLHVDPVVTLIVSVHRSVSNVSLVPILLHWVHHHHLRVSIVHQVNIVLVVMFIRRVPLVRIQLH